MQNTLSFCAKSQNPVFVDAGTEPALHAIAGCSMVGDWIPAFEGVA